MKIPTLSDLNMRYMSHEGNEEIDRGAILECSSTWTLEQLDKWLTDYAYDMLESVRKWLSDSSQISEGSYLAVWWD